MDLKSPAGSIEWQEASSNARKWSGMFMQSRTRGGLWDFQQRAVGREGCTAEKTAAGLEFASAWGDCGGLLKWMHFRRSQLGRELLVLSYQKSLTELARWVFGKQEKGRGGWDMLASWKFDRISQEVGTILSMGRGTPSGKGYFAVACF